MAEISVGHIELSSYNPETGVKNTANVYNVEGIPRELSIAGLAMAICLQRATALETDIVKLMSEMQATTKKIEELSGFESILVRYADTGIKSKAVSGKADDAWAIDWITVVKDKSEIPAGWGPWADKGRWTQWLFEYGVLTKDEYEKTYWKKDMTSDDVSKILDLIETQLDSLNTNSQEKMITLQSTTIKRDQSFDMLTSLVKSFMSMNVQIGANFR